MFNAMKAAMVLPFLTLGGCAYVDINNAPINAEAETVAGWKLAGVEVIVPDELTLSTNPDVQKPKEDLNWWEAPDGDRRAQIDAIMTDGIYRGATILTGTRPVRLEVTLLGFHALTPTARRRSLPADHDIKYAIRVIDVQSGAVVASDDDIASDTPALTADEGDAADARGETQRVQITEQVAGVVRAWLASSGGLEDRQPIFGPRN